MKTFKRFLLEAKKPKNPPAIVPINMDVGGHQHDVEVEQEAINSGPPMHTHTIYNRNLGGFETVVPKISIAAIPHVMGIDRDSNGLPSEQHTRNIARLQEVLSSYKYDDDVVDVAKTPRNKSHKIVKSRNGTFSIRGLNNKQLKSGGVPLRGLTQHEANKYYYGPGAISLGVLDGRQLTAIPHVAMPHEIRPKNVGSNIQNNDAWDKHIQEGMQHAFHLFNTDKKGFADLLKESKSLFGNTTVWSTSSKLEATNESDKTIRNIGIYAPPADTGHVDNRNACANCTKGCKNSCLSQSGYGGFDSTKVARIRRAHIMHAAPAHFGAKFLSELLGHHKAAVKEGSVLYIRPNATTDHKYHAFIPELFHSSHMGTDSRGVQTIKHPQFKGAVSYFYTAVPSILSQSANPTFSAKENNTYALLKHLQADRKNTSWIPYAIEAPRNKPEGYRHPQLPHGVVFTLTKKNGTQEHHVVPTVNGDDRDDRPNDFWKSLDPSSPDGVHNTRIRTQLASHPTLKLVAGTAAVGTTKLPIDQEEAQRVRTVGKSTKFLHDPDSKPPAHIQAMLNKSGLGDLTFHHINITEPKISLMDGYNPLFKSRIL